MSQLDERDSYCATCVKYKCGLFAFKNEKFLTLPIKTRGEFGTNVLKIKVL